MLQHIFSLKSIVFYGTAIVSVMTLFSVTTSYGETHLKAAKLIAGRYRFVNSDCLNGTTLRLEQSGRYLTAAIVSSESTIANTVPPSLSGVWSGELTAQGTALLKLSGQIPKISTCYVAQPAWFQGQVEKQTFSGQLIFANGDRVPFRSQLEPKPDVKTDRSH